MSVHKGINVASPVIQATIGPVASTGSSFSTAAYLDMGQFEQIRYTMLTSLGSTNTFDAMVLQATSTGGASAKAISGKAITQIVNGTASAVITANQISVQATDLDINNSFRYIKLVATVGSLASTNVICAVAEGSDVRTSPQTNITVQNVS